MVAKGVGLEVLEYRFCSRGGYGDVMLDGMNIMFEYGKFVQKVTSGTYTPHPRYKA
jgi:hypothetical protein